MTAFSDNNEDWLNHENWTDEKYHNKINEVYELSGICGCGNPEGTLLLMLEILEQAKSPNFLYDIIKPYEDFKPCLGDFILYQLTESELIEHGSSVYGSWLTEKGKKLVSLIKELSETTEEIPDEMIERPK